MNRSLSTVESMERRFVLSGNVTATLSAGGLLEIEGDAQANGIVIGVAPERVAGQDALAAGVTNVDLDTDLLASAAGLTVSRLRGSAPARDGFDVAFRFSPRTNFVYANDPFAPVSGAIGHLGTVTFNATAGSPGITVGNFVIGYDADRVGGERSGFFVRTTVGNLGILFDLSTPGNVTAGDNRLSITDADLLVSNEFATQLLALDLATTDLTGADVGGARIDGFARDVVRPTLQVIGQGAGVQATTVNGERRASFAAAAVRSIDVSLGEGNDSLGLRQLRLENLEIATGAGNDRVLIDGLRARSLSVNLGAGDDLLSIADAGVSGALTAVGGEGRDAIRVFRSVFGSRAVSEFENLPSPRA